MGQLAATTCNRPCQDGDRIDRRQPLDYAIVGGLLVSQVLTLFTTPVVYIYLDRLGTTLRRPRRGVEEAPAAPSPAE